MYETFKFYCQKVLPLVYDQSLSYYEVLCKVVEKLNELGTTVNSYSGAIEQISNDNANTLTELRNLSKTVDTSTRQLQSEISEIQSWIEKFDYEKIAELLSDVIPKAVLFSLNAEGRLVVSIPQSFNQLVFRTSGYDYIVTNVPTDYGHLCIIY